MQARGHRSVRGRSGLLAILLVVALGGSVAGQSLPPESPAAGSPAAGSSAAGSSAAGSPAALLEALARVPADAATPSSIVSYVDYRAIEAAGGAERPVSLAALIAALEADDPAAEAWLDAMQGVASGPSDLLADLFGGGPSWPVTAGFDFVEVDRALHFGEPPSDGTVLVGSFRPEAVAAAYEGHDFVGTAMGERTLWCDAAGCDRGHEVDLAAIDPTMPFGGRLGRRQPLAAGSADLLSSADEATVRGMLAAAGGEITSLAALPDYRALALSPAEGVSIAQGMLLPGIAALTPIDLVDLVELGGSTPEMDQALLAELAELPAVGPLSAFAIIGGTSGDEEVVTIAFAVPDHDAAGSAAVAVAERLAQAPSLREGRALADVLGEVGLTSVTTRTLPASDEVAATSVVELRAPLEAGTGDATRGRLYRLFVRLVMTRDIAWLAPLAGSG